MIAACAIAFAAVTQAAQFSWQFDADGAYAGNSTYYVFAGNSSVGATLAALLTAEGTDGTKAFTDALTSYNYQTGTLTSIGMGAGSLFGVTDDAYATVFIFEDGVVGGKVFDYIVYDASGSVYTPPDSNPGAVEMYGSDYGNPEYATSWGTGTVANVPEPTSGLMLLLGMGALALRRRRA